ncbi:MAG: CHRD domain-containing protein, partial [Roseiarcus sp.]
KAELSATLDTDTNLLTWTVSYSGLTGAPIGAHFHGPISYSGLTPEENAPIQVGTPGNLASPFKGSSTITDVQAKDLKDGRWYFNVHTPKFPAGEVRGPVYRQ